MKILLSKKYPSDGGTIFIDKIADDFGAEVISLSDISPMTYIYVCFLDSKLGKFISRLPFFEAVISTLIIQLILLLDRRRISDIINEDDILLPSDKFFVLRIILKLTKKKVHFICLDLPWSYPNSQTNNNFIRSKTKEFLPKFSSIGACTLEMSRALGISGKKNIFINYSSFELYSRPLSCFSESQVFKLPKRPLKIVFAGNLRFRDAIQSLLNRLDDLKIIYELDIYSSAHFYDDRVANKGFLDASSLSLSLPSYDFGLVPMSFDKQDIEIVETSFPSKTFFYLAAGLPVLFEAPHYSSVAKTAKDYRFGTTVEELGTGSELSFDIRAFKVIIDRQWSEYFNFLGR